MDVPRICGGIYLPAIYTELEIVIIGILLSGILWIMYLEVLGPFAGFFRGLLDLAGKNL